MVWEPYVLKHLRRLFGDTQQLMCFLLPFLDVYWRLKGEMVYNTNKLWVTNHTNMTTSIQRLIKISSSSHLLLLNGKLLGKFAFVLCVLCVCIIVYLWFGECVLCISAYFPPITLTKEITDTFIPIYIHFGSQFNRALIELLIDDLKWNVKIHTSTACSNWRNLCTHSFCHLLVFYLSSCKHHRKICA